MSVLVLDVENAAFFESGETTFAICDLRFADNIASEEVIAMTCALQILHDR